MLSGGMRHKQHDPEDLPDWFIWVITIPTAIVFVWLVINVSF